jgi:hypothetical protein
VARREARGQWLAIALVVAYLITILGKGHGIVPTGLLLLAFAFIEPGIFAEPWLGIGIVLGWLGIGVMVARLVLREEPPAWMDLAGVALLAGSLVAFAAWSDAPEIVMVTGLPFGAAALLLLANSLRAPSPPRG